MKTYLFPWTIDYATNNSSLSLFFSQFYLKVKKICKKYLIS